MKARLARTVRFSWPWSTGRAPLSEPRGNTLVGWPGLDVDAGLHGQVTVEVEGTPDARTGYLVGIDRIDAAVRSRSLPRLGDRITSGSTPPTALEVLRLIHDTVCEAMSEAVAATTLRLETHSAWRIESNTMSTPVLIRRYEFSASHRLHLPELDDDANRELFGKCSNPHGHGHNYEFEVHVALPEDPRPGTIHRLDEVIGRTVIDRFDHKHLNLDLEDFKDRVPSVENIAARCVELLEAPIAEASVGGRLRAVTVWETARTACTIEA